ncbi:hypothetical protein MNB_SM-7-1455 [hydrothermal vent metagenome]|uniref:Peptidoglycan synthetase n=1 Tax=hydrothermal vent metagenome TaxID=652676 RepID=A0A1W1B8M5_9ZZZZ
MRLENIVALTNAKLLTSPEVSAFGAIRFEPSKVERGDIFVATNPKEIDEALLNGAYAIIFDKPMQISDAEVAWIKVDNLEDALLRLLRFRLIQKGVSAYRCDDVTIDLALGIETSKRVVVVHEEIIELTKRLWDIKENTTLLFSSKRTNPDLFVDIKDLPQSIDKKIEVVERTLFECSFIFDGHYYERVFLSPFFLPFLERLLNFYHHHDIEFRLRRFEHIEHFEIVYTNKNYEIKEFGSSERVLIFEKDIDLFTEEIGFLKSYAPWAKMIYLLPQEDRSKDCQDCYNYSDIASLFKLLDSFSFHFALIGGVGKEIMEKYSKFAPTQLTFDL